MKKWRILKKTLEKSELKEKEKRIAESNRAVTEVNEISCVLVGK